MATFADYDIEEQKSAGPPISAHPAFPAIVALWFAALLGLGSLILPIALLERLTAVTGIAALVPSAAPPLGFTARTTIALGGAILGAVLGLALARQVARGQAPRSRSRFSDDEAPCRRPISARDELGEEGLDSSAPTTFGSKRRALAIAESEAPHPYLNPVPLPGQDQQQAGQAGEALDLGEYVEPEDSHAAQEEQDFNMTDEPEFDPGERSAFEPRQEFVLPGHAVTASPQAPEPLPEPADQSDNDPVEPLSFAAPSLRRAPTPAAEYADAHPAVPQAYEPDPEELEPLAWAEEEEDYGFHDAEDTAGEGSLAQLGLVQLATRLGSAIERARAMRATATVAQPASPAVFTADEDFDAAAAEEAARARADFFGTPAQSASAGAMPAPAVLHSVPAPATGVRPPAPLGEIDFGEDDDSEAEHLSASFSLPLRSRPDAGTEPDGRQLGEYEEEEEDPTAEQEYSSLLAMKNPFLRTDEFVRVEEPEPEEGDIEATVAFPQPKETAAPARRAFDPPPEVAAQRAAPAAGRPGEAERELRAALETLQRLSGAG